MTIINNDIYTFIIKISRMSLSVELSSGDWTSLPAGVLQWVEECVALCQPRDVHIMDGSVKEAKELKVPFVTTTIVAELIPSLQAMLVKKHVMIPLPKYDNCYLVRTDPRDVARTESRTFLSTEHKRDSVPTPEGSTSQLGNWIHPDKLQEELDRLFPGCMTGRTMYVIPFSMGPIGSPLSRIGIEITDSAYVAISMGVMTRVGTKVLEVLGDSQFVKVSLCLLFIT